MSNTVKIEIIFLACLLNLFQATASKESIPPTTPRLEKIKWDNSLTLPDLDDRPNIGVAGAFSGFIGDNLIIAGGANFPNATPWNGGNKTYWNTIYCINITQPTSKWLVLPQSMPKALAYGNSIELPTGILCIGGCDSTQCYNDVFQIQLIDGQINIDTNWPALPVPLANATASLLGDKIYLAGGQKSMEKPEATKHFFVLDLNNRNKGWKELPSWPGEPRGYAVSTSQSDGLEQRFNSLIRILCSLAFILFQVGRMGIVLFLPAIALNVVTGFDIFLCIGLMGILSLIYTMMGGIEAVVWTDALQVVILLGGAILVVIMAACYIPDGFSGIIREATVDNKFDLGSLNFDMRQSTLWTVLIATFFTNLTTYGTDQTMVQRYMTTETEKQAQKSVLTNALLTIPATLLFFFVGTVLYVYYKHNPADLSLTITDGDAILPWYIYSQLPQGVTGLLISGIFAAAMSTLSSSMNSAATAYVVDIHSKIVKKEAKDNLHTAKIATFFLGIAGIAFAYMMATWEIKSLWDEFNKILGLVLGSLGGLFLLGMITRKANAAGALCGIIGSIFIQLIVIQQQSVHLLLYTTTGFASCFIIGYIASWIIPGKTKNIDHLTIYKIFSKK